jgi:steroid delta-isomerase-like uncharacterized protein
MRILSFIIALLFVTTVQAQRPCTESDNAAANIALVKRFYEAMNTRSGAVLDTVLAEHWLDIPLPPNQAPGREGMKATVAKFGSVFKDFKVVNDEFIASANKVVVRSTNTGVQVSSFLGHPATNKPFTMTSIDIHTICSGRIVESRHVEDWLSTLVQLGALPIKSPAEDSTPGR